MHARPPSFRTRASLEQARVVGRVGVGVVHGIISLKTRRPLDRAQKQHRASGVSGLSFVARAAHAHDLTNCLEIY